MLTWADFLAGDSGERVSRVTCTAAVLSVALHAAVILPFIRLPMPAADTNDTGIDVTFEFDSAPHGTPAPKPTFALLLPDPTSIDPPTAQDFLPPQPAVMQPAPTEEPTLEEALAPVDAPPAIDGREFAEAKPAPPVTPPSPAPPVHPLEPQPPVTVPPKPQPPPVTRAPREAKREAPPGAATHPASLSPGQGYAQRQAEADYFRQIVQRISRYRFYSRQQDAAPQGLVVTRLTLSRDGGVLDVALLKSSGSSTLDTAVVNTIRQASPFPPLPPALAGGGPQTFVVPVNYARDQ
ncbi:MAG TPA: energy transducer TonB [Reyranella sp.]|nr:energy transducer TonB [Reyranella sp.]